MLGLIIAIRDFIIAVILSWVGITFSPPNEDLLPTPDLPEKTLPGQPENRLGYN